MKISNSDKVAQENEDATTSDRLSLAGLDESAMKLNKTGVSNTLVQEVPVKVVIAPPPDQQ